MNAHIQYTHKYNHLTMQGMENVESALRNRDVVHIIPDDQDSSGECVCSICGTKFLGQKINEERAKAQALRSAILNHMAHDFILCDNSRERITKVPLYVLLDHCDLGVQQLFGPFYLNDH